MSEEPHCHLPPLSRWEGTHGSHVGAQLPLSTERIHLPGRAAPWLLGDPVEEGPCAG